MEVSLTASMRQNLLSLQQTAAALGQTQQRLSTGKKVNSALDNPVNFFQSQTLTNRANDLLGFKDAIGQAIQTINAADNAITGITTLINSAKAVAQNALSQLGNAPTSQTITISSLTGMTGGSTLLIGGSTFTAVTSAGSAGGSNFYINNVTPDVNQTASSLAAAINLTTEAHPLGASAAGAVITITPTTAGSTIYNGTGNTADIVDTGFTNNFTLGSVASGSDLTNSISSYNTLIAQINTMQSDAGYQGVNLLTTGAGSTLTVQFGNSHTLAVNGFDGSAGGVGLVTTANGWNNTATIQASVDATATALTNLQTNSSRLASNLSIVNARDAWISDITNTLQTGSDKLVLADSNQEGANMLMLQTRQSLGTTALSLSSQQAQSVLKLFG